MNDKKDLCPKALVMAVGVALFAPAKANQLTDQLIIKYTEESAYLVYDSPQNMQYLSQLAGEEIRHGRFMYDGSQVVLLNKDFSPDEIKRIISDLQKDANIQYVEEDKLMQWSATANDTFYNLQWHYFEAVGGINLELAWDTTTGFGATIAVLDTGYRPHVDLAANIVGGYDMIANTFVGNDGDGRDADAQDPGDWTTAGECGGGQPPSNQDSSWHGTHVAGTIGAVTNNNAGVAGIAFDAMVVPVRVLGKCGGFTSDIADGMVWASGGAVAGVPANPNSAQVLNLSLGGSGACSATTQNAVDTAVANGAVVVVAAGNSNSNVVNFNPGNCNNVVSVAATDRVADRAYYSNFGNLIDVAAPGGDVTVPPGGQDGVASTLNSGTTTPAADNYVYYQGTSMAAPHVAGVAGLMYSVNPGLTPAQVEAAIKSTARAFPGGSTCNTSNCGDGILDAAAAVAAVNVAPSAVLSAVDTDITVCTSDSSAQFQLNLTDFGPTTNMSVSGCPPGGTCVFTDDPVVSPDDNTNLNVTGIGAIGTGSYPLVATGTDSVDAGITDDLNLNLTIATSPATPTLLTPADGGYSGSLTPQLTWNSLFGEDFTIEVDDDPGFSSLDFNGMTNNGVMMINTTSLSPETCYYWRVSPSNACGTGSTSAVSEFYTGGLTSSSATSVNVPVAISASGTPTITSDLVVSGVGTIADVNLRDLIVTHTWINDLSVELTSPQGTTVVLMNQSCGNENNFDLSLDDEAAPGAWPCPPIGGGTYQPSNPLSAFDGEDADGTWTLTINDGANQDGGSLDNWSLEFEHYGDTGNHCLMVNADPVAVNDAAITNEDTMVSVSVLDNDSDPDVGDVLSVTSCTAASNGSVVQNGNNCEFTPNPNFFGSGGFNYAISDGNGGSDSASVTVTVSSVNDDPVAVNDAATTDEDVMVSVSVLDNDSDVDTGDTLTVTACSGASNGTVVQNGNNCEFTPSLNFNGTGGFNYAISDGNGGSDSASVTVTVNAVNNDPVAVNDAATTDEDVMVSVAVLGNDSDVDVGDTLSVTSCSGASNGTVIQNGNNCEFTPSLNFNGTGGFNYAISDGNGGSDSASVSVTVDPVNDDPVAVADAATTNEDVMVAVAVLTGDSDVDTGDSLSVTSCSGASNGTVVQNGNNCEFTPSLNFNGTGGFNYAISDGNGGVDSASVTVTVDPVNDDPVAVDDAATTDEDVMVAVAVLTGDSDVDTGDTLSVTACSGASNGTVVQNGNNCEFTPSLNFNGTGGFSYAISDGNGGSDSASVTITIDPVNDDPVAVNDAATTDEDTMVAVAVLTGDSDVDTGDTLSVTACSGASNGTVVQNGNNCEFTPSLNFNGTGGFSYAISDGNGGSDSASVTVTVDPVNDDPVAVDDAVTTDEDVMVAVAVLTGDSDVDTGDTLSVTSCSGASNGNVVQNGNNCEFTPSQNFNGTGGFNYAISDGNGGVDSASVTVTVDSVNDDPVAVDDAATTDEDVLVSVAVLTGDSDVDTGDTLSVTACSGASNGTVVRNGNNCEFTPSLNFNGTGGFSYAISDGNGGSDSASVTITIDPVNDDPVAVNDATATNEDTMVSVAVLTGDSDVDPGDVLSVTACSGASNGTVVQNGNNCEFTPGLDFNGTGGFNYAITDGNGGSDSASVTVTVNAVNDDPVAVDDAAVTDEDTLVSVAVLAGDSDVDPGDVLSVTSCSGASNGSVIQNGNNCEFTPSLNFNGVGSFNYAISDGNGGSDSASVTVAVNALNDDPVAVDDVDATNEDVMVSVAVLTGDSDVDPGDVLSVTSCSAASNGSVVQNGNNCEFTPDPDFSGSAGFNYAISDGNGGTDTASVTVTVAPVNDEPSMVINESIYLHLEDIGNPPLQSLACQFDFGPTDEDAKQAVQDMIVSIQSDPNGVLSSIDVDNNGELVYVISGNAGSAEVTVALQDDGGVANGGDDTSVAYTFTVNVQDYVFRSDFDTLNCQ